MDDRQCNGLSLCLYYVYYIDRVFLFPEKTNITVSFNKQKWLLPFIFLYQNNILQTDIDASIFFNVELSSFEFSTLMFNYLIYK